MSERLMTMGQTVGYDSNEKKLIITLSDKIANQMKADGWAVGHDEELGHFVSVKMAEA